MGTILTSTTDYDGVRSYLGVDNLTLPDAAITGITFLPIAEAVVKKNVAAQAVNGMRTVTQITALAADEPDKVFLKGAVAAYCAALFTPSSPNAVNTSDTLGEQTVDLGGIGTQWIEQGKVALQMFGFYLSQIENWVETTPTIFSIGGPTSDGQQPDTLSGFWVG
jgi:hypothetical protein